MLELSGVSGGYENDSDALCGVSLFVERGEIVSVVGRNGSGKSTLLRLALGIIKSSEGEVRIDGDNVRSMSRRSLARRVAYLSQHSEVCDMTVEEYVLHGRFAYTFPLSPYSVRDREIAAAAMKRAELTDLLHRPLTALSGGERQRAYLARILAQSTDYILLDEPTTYLDISYGIELMRGLRAIADEGRGVLCVMHDLLLALEYSDRIALLDGGRLVSVDTPRALCSGGAFEQVIGVRVLFDGERYLYDLK